MKKRDFIREVADAIYFKTDGNHEKKLENLIIYYNSIIDILCIDTDILNEDIESLGEKLNKLREENFKYEKQLGIDKICEEE